MFTARHRRVLARWLAIVLVAVFAIVGAGRVASAQPRKPGGGKSSSTASDYQEHLRAAARAAKENNWLVASAEYAAAHSLQPGKTTLAGMAEAAYQLRRWSVAYSYYEEYSRLAGAQLSANARASIDARIREIESKTAEIVLSVPEPDAVVTLDGADAGTGPLNRSMRVDAGRHIAVVTKEGTPPLAREFEAVAGTVTKVTIDAAKPQQPEEKPSSSKPGQRQAPDGSGPVGPIAGGPLPNYRALRAKKAPTIDGDLDDQVWRDAPKEAHFPSSTSVPYGQPTQNPTTVQIAYDADNLYVAFRCGYAEPGPRDDAVMTDEVRLIEVAEKVSVHLDGRHDHTTAKEFFVNRAGDRADQDISANGAVDNFAWRGIWDVATRSGPDGWTAEFSIPWSTIDAAGRKGEFEIGANFIREIPLNNESAFWSLPPPEVGNPPSIFGHISGIKDISDPHYFFLQPYVAGFLQSPPESAPPLRSFGRTEPAGVYAGLYARYRANENLQVDVTFNPDFSQVTPDQALSNLDRFQLYRPELRPFFADDLTRFSFGFGAEGSGVPLLFYSRTIGLRPDPARGVVEVPLVLGAKVVAHPWEHSQIAGLAVGLPADGRSIAMDEQVGVVRFEQNLEGGHRVGDMLLARSTPTGTYFAHGVDGSLVFFDNHLRLNGFAATSSTSGKGSGVMAGTSFGWESANLSAEGRLTDVSESFDPQLGFVAQGPGTRVFRAAAAYHPRINTEFLSRISLAPSVEVARTTAQDVLLYERPSLAVSALLVDGAAFEVDISPSNENVLAPFTIGGGRFAVAAGRYDTLHTAVSLRSADGRRVVVSAGYTEGTLFGGYERRPNAALRLNLSVFTFSTTAEVPLLHTPKGDNITSFILSGRGIVRYAAQAKTALAIEANTLDPRSTIQLVTSYTFGLLSTLALTLSQAAISVDGMISNTADRRAVASFAYGISPF